MTNKPVGKKILLTPFLIVVCRQLATVVGMLEDGQVNPGKALREYSVLALFYKGCERVEYYLRT